MVLLPLVAINVCIAAGGLLPVPDRSVYGDASKPVRERVNALLAQMTTEEKVK